MRVTIESVFPGNVLGTSITGKLHNKGYQEFLLKLEEMLDEHGKFSILLEMHNFRGWKLPPGGRTSNSTSSIPEASSLNPCNG